MNDIFLSYDRENRDRAQTFASVLEELGWSVWWDREIPLGKNFDEVIEHELSTASCVVVLWSKESIRSRWVKTEASAAAERNCLVPVLIDQVTVPLEFRLIQAAELWHWKGDANDIEFQRLVQAVKGTITHPSPRPPTIRREPPVAVKVKPRPIPKVAAAGIVLAVAIVALLLLRNETPIVDAPSTPEVSTDPVASSTTPPAGNNSVRPAPPRDAFSINIGDKVSDGSPRSGAGAIEKPHEIDSYVFTARPRQTVYFRMFPTAMASIKWRLVDDEGMEVFDTCLGCSTPGVQSLMKGGRYTLTVGSDQDSSTGVYEFQLYNVPPPQRFPIRLGDLIRDNVPGPGAGAIESPGVEDMYTFTARPRQRIYFQMREGAGIPYIKWRLVDDNGMELFDTCLGCTEPGVQLLARGGDYTLIVGNRNDPSTGVYRLQMFDVPPPTRFPIRIGDRVQPGRPGAGAGVIESPGSEDLYTFRALPGQRVGFRLVNYTQQAAYLKWRLTDDNGMQIFDMCFGCGQPAAETLTKGGIYTLTVGSTANPATAEYTFEITAR